MADTFTVLAADYHRNGSSGEGFVVALVLDWDEGRTFLVTDFSYDKGTTEYGYTSVVDVHEAARGNVYMFPRMYAGEPDNATGGNAWRGPELGGRYRAAIARFQEEQWMESQAHFMASKEG